MMFLIEFCRDNASSLRQYEQVKRILVDNYCSFGDKPVPTFLKPHFISSRQTRILRHAVESTSRILDKFIDFYLTDTRLQGILAFSEDEKELFAIDPGYSVSMVIARLDAFMNDEVVKFLEFNCDSPAGASYGEALEKAFKEISGDFPFLAHWDIRYTDRHQKLLNALISCYREFREKHDGLPTKPTIAIVDWKEVSTSSEFTALKLYFEQNGYSTIIADPRDFQINGNRLTADGQSIHLIYRRAIMKELLERRDEVDDFINGIKQAMACTCNPFRSCIAGNKKVLAILSDPQFQGIFDAAEVDIINQTIPWTRILSDTTVTYNGFNVPLKSFVTDNRQRLVMKPASSYGGKDVILGNETEPAQWEAAIDEHIESGSWVVQEYVPIPKEIFPVIDEENLSLQLKNVNINPFVFSGKYAGNISRVSESTIINVSQGGGMVASLSVEKKV